MFSFFFLHFFVLSNVLAVSDCGRPIVSGSSNAHGKTVSEPARYLIDGMLTSDVGQRHSVEEITGCQWLCDEVTLAQLRKTIFKDTPIFLKRRNARA
jgi:hypothetical protein